MKNKIIKGIMAPINPIIIPSNTKGDLTKKSVAPTYFMIFISSERTVIPVVIVLLIRKMETASNTIRTMQKK